MKTTVNVTNKSNGTVSYKLPEMGVRRVFATKETKKNIPVAELEALVGKAGGDRLLYHYLQIDDVEVINYLLNLDDIVPEYWLKEEDIPKWMNTCSVAEFLDALDFAPNGTIDLIKKYAVTVPLNNFDKRTAIKDKFGFDVTKAIELSKADEKQEETKSNGRRTESSIKTPAATQPTRRTTSSIEAPAADSPAIVIPKSE